MQFAVHPRRSPLPIARSSRMPIYRRKQFKSIAVLAFAIFSLLFIGHHIYSLSSPSLAAAVPSGVVIVTLLDRQRLSESYVKKIVTNREDYAKRHGKAFLSHLICIRVESNRRTRTGYTNFFASVADYADAIGDAPRTWAIAPAVRHAMAKYPQSAYFFHLSPHSLIMNPAKSLKSHILEKHKLEELVMKDASIVPPDSIIKTFAHQNEKDIELIITQDTEDLNPGSFILKSGEFARFFLDMWFDPLYRSYNFAKAETHGLDHILQWHPTVLARTALVPQRSISSYSKDSLRASPEGTYKDGDLVIQFRGCEEVEGRDCERELEPYYKIWLGIPQRD
ncbi:unnamed protein product [Penicillium salamii]|uniref:Galactosyl transferase n=1 Tax=Penicillium salamii TaxID=1612424 RepID=A0A9W4JCK7_9EURO|nr:unnamed protein product [Penicillium salamii]CAG8368474.1 unnamed protein product [Penicillium salamii]CAG8384043.1 unnamed protein product [Penicillium salamii]